MTAVSGDSGREAEERAARHLRGLGWEILARNFRTRLGEIDIVALSPDRATVVFAEVRFRSRADYGTPEESVVPAKRRKIVRAAQIYLQTAPAAARAASARFDVIAVTPQELRHVENAFEAL